MGTLATLAIGFESCLASSSAFCALTCVGSVSRFTAIAKRSTGRDPMLSKPRQECENLIGAAYAPGASCDDREPLRVFAVVRGGSMSIRDVVNRFILP